MNHHCAGGLAARTSFKRLPPMKAPTICLTGTLMILMSVSEVGASVTEYTSKTLWESAAGDFTTITFTGYPEGTLINTQYAGQGVLFTDGLDFSHQSGAFLNDGAGLFGAVDEIAVAFATPMNSIAADYPGLLKIKLYNAGQLIYSSADFSTIISHFAGLISTQTFDSAIISDPAGSVYIDDLHFGAIPAPGGMGLVVLGGVVARRRRLE
jgi:hypothetical protein